MNLNDFHLFLLQWGAWNKSEIEKLNYKGPNFYNEYTPQAYSDDYSDDPMVNYPESEFEHANDKLKFVDTENRAIIKGVYLDDAEKYILRSYGEDGVNRALRAFLSEFESVEAA